MDVAPPIRSTLMRLFGLPLSSLVVLVIIPPAIVAWQYYLCWEIKTGRRD